jgi:8-oxo-dGTP pyrophosphatase MutT (NUDIX family)
MLDLDPNRQGPAPRDASTLVVVRDIAEATGKGIEVFCVERQKVGFLAGAVVFPGGKLEASDRDPEWEPLCTPTRATRTPIAASAEEHRGLAIAACREAFEEAAILPVAGVPLSHAELLAWREEVSHGGGSLRELLKARGTRLALGSLHAFARWVTPVAESRRFDTRFFLFVTDSAATGAHDDHETTASFWARPADVLDQHASGSLMLAPPTHRTLQVLAGASDTAAAVAIAEASCLEPICPRALVHHDATGDAIAIVLPGDPEHEVRTPRVAGTSRYVFRNGRFLPEDPPG